MKTTTALMAAALLVACGGAEQADREDAATAGDTAAATAGADDASAADAARAARSLLDANEASEGELRGVAALTDSALRTVLSGRPFADVVALDAALSTHLDSAARTELYRELWIPIDLNGAPDEAILLIPGVGDRMLHEFKEYRPYRAMAEFRREIGKYVDEEEVARLERYVRLEAGG